MTDNDKPLLLRADDVPLVVIGEIGRSVVEVVGEKRSTWRRWNLMAEASRQTMGWRFASIELAERVGLSPSPCARRVRLLEKAGITSPDDGIVTLKAEADATAFLKACGQLRFWKREPEVHAV